MTGSTHRWVFVPILLVLVLLAGLMYTSRDSYRRLASANERVRVAQDRETKLAAYLLLVTEAETGQRGFLLTRDAEYLVPYERARKELPQRLAGLRRDYSLHGPASAMQKLDWLDGFTGSKMRELAASLQLYADSGRDSALAVVRADFGNNSMGQIREVIRALQDEEGLAVKAAVLAWRQELRIGRTLIGIATALNMLLVVAAGLLVVRDQRRREEHARTLQQRNEQLDQIVQRRTEALSNLSSELQRVAEYEKRALSRELHDELGSLLIATKMDISWLRRRLDAEDPDAKLRWDRVLASLDEGVSLKRRVVENLRPTLLDNMGLYPALRWLTEETCGRASLTFTERYPSEELHFTDDASIAIFRVVQESLLNIVRHANASAVQVLLDIRGAHLVLRIHDDGEGIAADRVDKVIGSHGLASMRHRVMSLGGRWTIGKAHEGGTLLVARFPLQRVLLPAGAAANR